MRGRVGDADNGCLIAVPRTAGGFLFLFAQRKEASRQHLHLDSNQ